jgi:hypothetical protein
LEFINESNIPNVKLPAASFGSVPSWAKVKTVVQCEELYLNGDDEDDFDRPSLADLKIPEKIFKGQFSHCNFDLLELNDRFWVIYKPDFSITTWFNDKPEDLSQSAIVLVHPIETIETSENYDTIYSYIKFSVDLVIPFSEIAKYFEPTDCQIPLPGFAGLTEQTKYNYWEQYIRIIDKDIIFIEAYGAQGYVYEWFICQKLDEYESPVVILYHHICGSQSFTVFGNCVLTREQWENIDLCCR